MTAPVLCDCCDLPLYSCGTAVTEQRTREHRARRERALAEPGVVAAKYLIPSCPGCRSGVPAGDPIRKSGDGWIGVLCCDGLDP